MLLVLALENSFIILLLKRYTFRAKKEPEDSFADL